MYKYHGYHATRIIGPHIEFHWCHRRTSISEGLISLVVHTLDLPSNIIYIYIHTHIYKYIHIYIYIYVYIIHICIYHDSTWTQDLRILYTKIPALLIHAYLHDIEVPLCYADKNRQWRCSYFSFSFVTDNFFIRYIPE